MAQQLRPLDAPSEDPDLIPSTHKMAHTLYNSNSRRQVKGIGNTDGGLCRFYYSFDNIGILRKIAFEAVRYCLFTMFYGFLALHTPKTVASAMEGSGNIVLTAFPCITGGKLWDAVWDLRYFLSVYLVGFVAEGVG